MTESFLAQFKTPAPDPKPPGSGAGPNGHVGFDNAVIEAELDNVRRATEGTRNATLNQAAFNLRQLYPEDMILGHLYAASRECGLGRVEAHNTIMSAFKGAERNPRPAHRLPRTDKIARPLEDLPSIDGYTDPQQWPAKVDWKAVWDNPTELEWILEPFIPAGRYMALYSPPKVGKSLLMLELCVAISNGREALGAPTKPTRVLYIDRENDVQTDIKARLEAMGHTYGDLDNLIYHSYLSEMPDLDTPQGGQYLAGLAAHYDVGLIVLDTISRFITGEENDNNTWIKLHKYTGMALKEQGRTLLRLDHSGKDLDKGQRGGSAKMGDIDMVWRMTEVDPQVKYALKCEAARIQVTEDSLILTREPVPLRHTVDTRRWSEVKEEAVLAALDDAGLEPSAGRVRCEQALKAAGIKIRTTTLADIIKRRQMRLT